MDKEDAQKYGLPKRIKLLREGNKIIIDKRRKSRIIMKDGRQVLDIAKAINLSDSKSQVNLLIQGPICSKTVNYLAENNIGILKL